ncbi:hypothetical protein HPB50_022621 [Hyalomma asiaticum]|uniref:Uncharacterized protein n=1 Tax=Hyalomma asiaticum TaxID=266040 RepID=A0ACB7SKC7_HYAAI|nr:hypothetical protein HPB50_022621 [Hyalomma asiaticum]
MDVVVVEETEIIPEDATLEAGWISSQRNKHRKHTSNAPTSPTPQNSISGTAISNGHISHSTAISQRPARKPRQLRLPDNHVKVVIRLKEGLNLSKMGEAQVRDAILREVDLNAVLLKEMNKSHLRSIHLPLSYSKRTFTAYALKLISS